MMIEALFLLLALCAGTALGFLFFGALWWTVRRGIASDRPALWFALSLPLRMSVAVAGFIWIAGDDWLRLPAALLGFIAARLALNHWLRAAGLQSSAPRE